MGCGGAQARGAHARWEMRCVCVGGGIGVAGQVTGLPGALGCGVYMAALGRGRQAQQPEQVRRRPVEGRGAQGRGGEGLRWQEAD